MGLIRKYGVISISRDLIEENPKTIMDNVMSKMIILKCELEYVSNTFVYQCYCEEFRELEPREVPPTYIALVTTNTDGTIKNIEFKEQI